VDRAPFAGDGPPARDDAYDGRPLRLPRRSRAAGIGPSAVPIMSSRRSHLNPSPDSRFAWKPERVAPRSVVSGRCSPRVGDSCPSMSI
jgi:hypothetical protein